MAKERVNRKGTVVPKNDRQRQEQAKKDSKRFRKAADHDVKKRPRTY